jgi:hypothetical protein
MRAVTEGALSFRAYSSNILPQGRVRIAFSILPSAASSVKDMNFDAKSVIHPLKKSLMGDPPDSITD